MADVPQFSGYSVGHWLDEDGDGRYDTLIVETRGIKGPRTFEMTGIPLHQGNQTIVTERIYLDKVDSNLLHNEITTIDNPKSGSSGDPISAIALSALEYSQN
jgi:hypothetical protein